MKKTNLIIFGILLALVALVLIIRYSNRPPAERIFRDFAVEDTASINRIFMADKRGRTIDLERQAGHWTVNGQYTARRDLVNLLLETFRRMEVAAPVPRAKLDYVLRSLSTNSVKTEIYQNNRLSKTYYVGGVTEDFTGTYMIMENSDYPFEVHIPGFSGYLSVRYNTSINEWRERIIFNYDVRDIRKIKVEYPDEMHESFIAINNRNNQFDLKTIDNEPVDFMFDTLTVKRFISKCKFLGFEAFIKDDINQHIIDSLQNEPILSRYTVVDYDGEKKSVEIYLRPNVDKMFDDDGILYDFDIDRLYAVINDRTQVVLVQYYIIDPITYKKSFFKRRTY